MAAPCDEAHDYVILLACPRGLPQEQVLVDFSASYDRRPFPDPASEELIEQAWQRKRAQQPSIYNGSKFRYAGFDVLESEARPREPGPEEAAVLQKCIDANEEQGGRVVRKVRLKLGLSDYRTLVGTNLRDDWKALIAQGTTDEARCCHLADPLGNAALVRTADKGALLLQRGEAVGEFPNHPVFPGGHSEPVEVGITTHEGVRYPEERQQLNTLIGMEMFAGIIREVEEETGAPADTLSNVRFLGVMRRKLNSRPVAMFVCDCSLTTAEVMAKYQNAEDKFESTKLFAVPFEELKSQSQGMPGCHRGGCALALAFLELEGQINAPSQN